ncbi:MAG: GIY-YIG nuclease family protein [Arenimonas sp.]|nr:GIY-YIG nuclease family protein [Arenimonas sp.]
MNVWILYLIECQRGTRTVYYTGITTDIQRRFNEHLAGTGARFTRAHKPIRVLASCTYANRSEASRAEAAVKKLPRSNKLAFFDKH